MGMSREDLRALSDDALAEYDMACRRAERLSAVEKEVIDLDALNVKLLKAAADLLRSLNDSVWVNTARNHDNFVDLQIREFEEMIAQQQQARGL